MLHGQHIGTHWLDDLAVASTAAALAYMLSSTLISVFADTAVTLVIMVVVISAETKNRPLAEVWLVPTDGPAHNRYKTPLGHSWSAIMPL